MKDKWRQFHSLHTPVPIEVNEGHSDIVSDWQRDWDRIFINGKPLASHMNERGVMDKNDLDADKLKDFFKEVVLQDYSGDKEQAAEDLMKRFHQGGLLHPVSGGISFWLQKASFAPNSQASPKIISIVTTKTGFVMQESYTVRECQYMGEAEDAKKHGLELDSERLIRHNPGSDLLQAQGTLDVTFDEKGKHKVNVLNLGINYGNDAIRTIADNRNWFQKLADYMRNLFGANSVKDFVPALPKQQEVPTDTAHLEDAGDTDTEDNPRTPLLS